MLLEVEGVEYRIALWEKKSAAGNAYLQVSEDKKAQEQNAQPGGGAPQPRSLGLRSPPTRPMTSPARDNEDPDDEIPF